MRVSTTNFKNAFGKYLKEVMNGKDIIVTKNGKGVAKLIKYSDPLVYIMKEKAGEYSLRERVSYEEYLVICEKEDTKYELIDGVLYLMASPSHMHQVAVREISGQFYIWFSGKECEPFTSPYDVKLYDAESSFEDDPNVVQPDVLVICDSDKVDEKGRYQGRPTLVAEVLSQGTRSKDMVAKLNLYMRSGVSEYWVVDLDTRSVHVYAFEEFEIKSMKTYSFDNLVESDCFEGLKIDLTRIK